MDEQSDIGENVLRFSFTLKTAANYTNSAFICNKFQNILKKLFSPILLRYSPV